MPSRPPDSDGERGSGDDDSAVVCRVPLAMTVALEVVAALGARRRDAQRAPHEGDDAATSTARSDTDDASTA